MHTRSAKLLHTCIVMITCCLPLLLTACSPGPSDTPSSSSATQQTTGPLKVVATTSQWGSLATSIGGDDVKVTSILGSGDVQPSNFNPSEQDVKQLNAADVIVVNGAGYDDWASDHARRGSTIVSAAQTVGALEGDNPYLWFSKDARTAVANELSEAFIKVLPDERATFTKHLQTWQTQEQGLEDDLKAFSKERGETSYAATRPVAFYLLADLGFNDVTPKSYAQSVESGETPDEQQTADFTSLFEDDDDRPDILVHDPEQSDAASDAITDAAQHAQIPVVNVTEQMPADSTNLDDWISTLVTTVANSLDATQGSSEPTDGSSSDDSN